MFAPRPPRPAARARRSTGFTILELMVTVTVLAVLLGIAIPNLRVFVVRNQVASVANEFSASVSQARNLAITRNSCVTLCQSDTTQNAISGGSVECTTAGTFNWLKGSLVVVNPTCSAPVTAVSATHIIQVLQPAGSAYQISDTGGNDVRQITFDARGLLGQAAVLDLKLEPTNSADTLATDNTRQICVSRAGRVTIRKATGEACS